MALNVLLKNTVWSMLNHLLSRGVLMLSTIFLARNLLVDEFAKYSYFNMTVTMLATYCSLGLGVAVTKYFSELVNEKSVNNVNNVNNVISISFFIPFLMCIIIFFLPKEWVFSNIDISFYLFISAIFFVGLSNLTNNALIGMEEYKNLTIISVFSSIFIVVGCLLAVKNTNVYYFIVFYIFSIIFSIIFSFKIIVAYIGDFKLRKVFIFKIPFLKEILKFSWPLLIVSLLNAVSAWLLGKRILDLHGNYYFSVYMIGLQWFALALFIPGMISRVLLPRLIIDKENQKKNLIFSICISIACAIFISIIAFVFGESLISFYGSKYISSQGYLSGVIALSVLYAAANTLGNAVVINLGSIYWLAITLIWFVFLNVIFYFTINTNFLTSVLYSHFFAGLTLLLSTVFICRMRGVL